MVNYKQLALHERYIIQYLSKAGFLPVEIARKIQRSKSTISRELKRNKGKRGYRPQQAHDKALHRRKTAFKAIKFTPAIKEQVKCRLENEQWSPDQISGWLKLKGASISHETIYQYILQDKKQHGTLYANLRVARRQYRKRFGSNDRRGQIRNRKFIDQRPACVQLKTRIGDWEGDTVIGKNHRGALVTLVERKSKVTLIRKVSRYTAKAVNKAILSMTRQYKDILKMITVDNGQEFAGHEALAQMTGAEIYFAHPYHSWERGLNENTNGLIRQYFPKKTNFNEITNAQIRKVQNLLNDRPRKTLGYLSPNEYLVKERYKNN